MDDLKPTGTMTRLKAVADLTKLDPNPIQSVDSEPDPVLNQLAAEVIAEEARPKKNPITSVVEAVIEAVAEAAGADDVKQVKQPLSKVPSETAFRATVEMKKRPMGIIAAEAAVEVMKRKKLADGLSKPLDPSSPAKIKPSNRPTTCPLCQLKMFDKVQLSSSCSDETSRRENSARSIWHLRVLP